MIPVQVQFSNISSGLALDDFITINSTVQNLTVINKVTYQFYLVPNSFGWVSVRLPLAAALYVDGTPTIESNELRFEYQSDSPEIYLMQNFDALPNGAAWPQPWVVAQNSPVVAHTIRDGEACLEGLVLNPPCPLAANSI